MQSMTKELKQIYTSVDARDRIIEAALNVFAEIGYAGASMRIIAKKAGVSAALIHHHFKNKETLWKIVDARISVEFQEYVSENTNNGDPQQSFLNLMHNFQKYWIEHPQSLRLQLWRLLSDSIEERELRSSMLNQYFVPKIKRAQSEGLVRDDIPAGLAMLTFGGLILFFLHNRFEFDHAILQDGERPLSDDEIFDYLINIIGKKS